PHRPPASVGDARAAPGERAGQHVGPRARHAAWRRAGARSADDGANNRYGANADAGFYGEAERWAAIAVARGCGALLFGRSQLDFRGRQTADHAESGTRRGRPALPRSGPATHSPWTDRSIASKQIRPSSLQAKQTMFRMKHKMFHAERF